MSRLSPVRLLDRSWPSKEEAQRAALNEAIEAFANATSADERRGLGARLLELASAFGATDKGWPAPEATNPLADAEGYFQPQATVDLSTIGKIGPAVLGEDNELTVSAGDGGPVTLDLNPGAEVEGPFVIRPGDNIGPTTTGTDISLQYTIPKVPQAKVSFYHVTLPEGNITLPEGSISVEPLNLIPIPIFSADKFTVNSDGIYEYFLYPKVMPLFNTDITDIFTNILRSLAEGGDLYIAASDVPRIQILPSQVLDVAAQIADIVRGAEHVAAETSRALSLPQSWAEATAAVPGLLTWEEASKKARREGRRPYGIVDYLRDPDVGFGKWTAEPPGLERRLLLAIEPRAHKALYNWLDRKDPAGKKNEIPTDLHLPRESDVARAGVVATPEMAREARRKASLLERMISGHGRGREK